MRIDEFEFQDRNGNEIEPTKNQLVVYIKSLHKQIAELQKQLEEKDKYTYTGKEVGEIERKYDEKIDTLEQQLKSQPAEIVEKIRKSIHYYPIALLDSDKEPRIKTLGISKEVLDNLLQEYQK